MSANNTPTGSYSLRGEAPKKKSGWLVPLLVLLGLLLLALLLWLLLRGGDDDDAMAAAASSPTTTTSATATTPPASATPSSTPSATASAGQLVAGGQSILAAADGTASLARFAGQTASANSVQVQAVSADEGFWLGSSTTNRVWVALTGTAGESGVDVDAGDRVSFQDAAVVPTTADYATQAGVSTAEGAAQLIAQGQHLEIAKSEIQVTS